MSKEQPSHHHHHHHHHSHGRRNWVLPLVCVAMVVGGGYWMNGPSSDSGPQQQVGPTQAGTVGPGQASPAGSADVQGEPGMQTIAPQPGQPATSGIPAGMGQAEPGVGTVSGMGSGSAPGNQTTTR